ncbi:uncharacterized protein [Rutidosis leptorrhynchoides]|uniref:uncharacterized protein n=1 Tax=Rutidosis leptorrhynchoides TaxID=125765 RepID=UPI003A99BBA2
MHGCTPDGIRQELEKMTPEQKLYFDSQLSFLTWTRDCDRLNAERTHRGSLHMTGHLQKRLQLLETQLKVANEALEIVEATVETSKKEKVDLLSSQVDYEEENRVLREDIAIAISNLDFLTFERSDLTAHVDEVSADRDAMRKNYNDLRTVLPTIATHVRSASIIIELYTQALKETK